MTRYISRDICFEMTDVNGVLCNLSPFFHEITFSRELMDDGEHQASFAVSGITDTNNVFDAKSFIGPLNDPSPRMFRYGPAGKQEGRGLFFGQLIPVSCKEHTYPEWDDTVFFDVEFQVVGKVERATY